MLGVLEKLFEKFHTSPKDRYEISQIYELLPPEKKKNLIDNFSLLHARIKKIQHDIAQEQELLIGSALTNIRDVIAKLKR